MNNLRTLFASTRIKVVAGAMALLVVGVVLGAVITAAIPALAAGHASNTGATTTPSTTTVNQYCTLYEQTLASNLGVSVSKLESANVASLETVLAQLVKDGKITQAQADAAKAMITANGTNVCSHIDALKALAGAHRGMGPGGAGFSKFGPALKGVREAVQSAVAAKLGLSVTQMQTDLATTDIVTLAKSKGVDQATLNATITATVKTQLDSLVKAGTVTSAMETQGLAMLAQQLAAGHYGLFGLAEMGPMGH